MARGDGRILKRGNWLWISYYDNGSEVREPARHVRTGAKLAATNANVYQAQRHLKKRRDQVIAAKNGGPAFMGPAQEKISVSDLLDRLQSKYKREHQDSPQNLSTLRRAREDFGHYRAVSLAAADIREYGDRRRDEGAQPASINRILQCVRAAFRLAAKDKTISSVPYFDLFSESGNVRKGFFEASDVRRVVAALPPDLADFISFLFASGWRKGEASSLRWTDVDSDTIYLRAEDAKNGTARSVGFRRDCHNSRAPSCCTSYHQEERHDY